MSLIGAAIGMVSATPPEVVTEPAKKIMGLTQDSLNSLGLGITALGGVAVTVWGWIVNQKKKLAENKADVAEARAEMKIADAQGSVYALMEKRMGSLEEELKSLRTDLNQEREHSRQLERKLYLLDTWVRSQNLTPPVFS